EIMKINTFKMFVSIVMAGLVGTTASANITQQYRIASINGEGFCIADGSLANNSFGQVGEVATITMAQAGISIQGITPGETAVFRTGSHQVNLFSQEQITV